MTSDPRLARPNLPRLDSLTGLRFFAAYLVFLHHFTNFAPLPLFSDVQLPVVGTWSGFGTTGVSFFFVLSGFVLSWSFVPDDTAPRFYLRRFARVWPLHFVTTVMAVPVFYYWRDVPMEWTGTLLSVFLLHAWVPSAAIYFAGNPASWSLSCEMFFYGIHPLLVRRTLLAGLGVMAGATVVVLVALFVAADRVLALWPSYVGWLVYVSPIFRVGEFLVGMALAAMIRRGVRFPVGLPVALVVLFGWFALFYSGGPHLPERAQVWLTNLSYPAIAVVYALVIGAAAQLDIDRRRSPLRWRPVVLLGQWSYALYLVHATIIYGMVNLIGARSYSLTGGAGSLLVSGLHAMAWLGVVTLLGVGASYVLYRWIEQPVEARLRRLQERRPAAVVSGAEVSPAG